MKRHLLPPLLLCDFLYLIMPVYTKRGDGGQTYLASGRKVPKDHLRIKLCGAVDELNSAIGLAVAYLKTRKTKLLRQELCMQQHLLFDLGSELAGYENPNEIADAVCSQDIENLEKSMDRMEEKMEKKLGPMRNFILPGGVLGSAALHLARTICRRLERQMTGVIRHHKNQDEKKKKIVKKTTYSYINRLSDYFFTTARFVNYAEGVKDALWQKRNNSPK